MTHEDEYWRKDIKGLSTERYDGYMKQGIVWYINHKELVDRLVADEDNAYAPGLEDFRNPALWKSAHWMWFFNAMPHVKIRPETKKKKFLGLF